MVTRCVGGPRGAPAAVSGPVGIPKVSRNIAGTLLGKFIFRSFFKFFGVFSDFTAWAAPDPVGRGGVEEVLEVSPTRPGAAPGRHGARGVPPRRP